MPRFRADAYPGPRPDGPALVHRGRVLPLDLSQGRIEAPAGAAAAVPVLREEVRWSVAYGSNACPDRLVDKELDGDGALLLPARMQGWATAWEGRRAPGTGTVPLTLVPAPGTDHRTWVLGIPAGATAVLDASEGRGRSYLLGRVGAVAVADRWLLDDALAYGPGPDTRCLLDGAAWLAHPDRSQPEVRRLVDAAAPCRVPAALPRSVHEGWPRTPLGDLPLFLYGTLQPGRSRWHAIADLVDVVGPASTNGVVVATPHGYPAADLAAAGTVHGTLVAPRTAATAVQLYRAVDGIEGVPWLFRRRTVRVGHDRAEAWAAAYAWAPGQGPPPGEVVADGRWR
jgi:gamma-glutamylcyclotransferase (GGCT)/AIG2-like uncharacterized protein YtfP